MEFLEILLQALFLGLSGFGIPLTVITYCILSSIKNSGKIGGFLFSGNLAAQIVAASLLFLSADKLIELAISQLILNIISVSLYILFGVKLTIAALKNTQILKNFSKQDTSDSEYEDIYSHSSASKKYKSKNNTSKAIAFLLAFVFNIINTRWFLWFNISLKSLVIKSYIKCGQSIEGIFGSVLFIIIFLFAQFIFFTVISKLSFFMGKILNQILIRILISLASIVFLFYAIFTIIDTVNTVSILV